MTGPFHARTDATAADDPLAAAAAIPVKTRSRVSDFIVFVVLPLLITTAAMTIGANMLLNGIAQSVNAQEESRAWQAVQSGIGALEDRLSGIATDYAHWDDAARETYGTLNAAWVANMWGVGSVNYDALFLLSPEGRPLIEFRNNKRFDGDPKAYLGRLFPRIVEFAASGDKGFTTLSTIAGTADGLAIVTAAPVLPTTPGLSIGQKLPNVVVFVNHLTPARIDELSKQYQIHGLAFTAAGGQASPGHVLTDNWNEPVATASWQSHNPGQYAMASYRSWVLGAILAMLCVLLPLTMTYFRRLTELEESQRQALAAARRDPLTGLLNRNAFIAALDAFHTAHPRDELSLLLVDIGDIRGINDSYGHRAGDEVIRTVTERLKEASGGRGLLSRVGGKSFAVAFSGADSMAVAENAAERASAGLATVRLGPGRVNLAANIGVADSSGRGTAPDELMREADLALYHASQAGPGQWRRYDTALDMSEIAGIAAQ